MRSYVKQELLKTRTLLDQVLASEDLLEVAEAIANRCIFSLQNGGKILFAGNGGSAADSQHLAAELVCRLSYDRPAMAAMALTTDTSALTAIGNDYSFDYLFARQIEALGREGDVFIGITTSGKSPNILRAFEAAGAKQMISIGFTGLSAPKLLDCCELILNIPASETPKIQEGHIIFGHIICALIEAALFGSVQLDLRQPLVCSN